MKILDLEQGKIYKALFFDSSLLNFSDGFYVAKKEVTEQVCLGDKYELIRLIVLNKTRIIDSQWTSYWAQEFEEIK